MNLLYSAVSLGPLSLSLSLLRLLLLYCIVLWGFVRQQVQFANKIYRSFVVVSYKYNYSVWYSRVWLHQWVFVSMSFMRGERLISLALEGFLAAVLLHAPTVIVVRTWHYHWSHYSIPAVTLLFGIFPCFLTCVIMNYVLSFQSWSFNLGSLPTSTSAGVFLSVDILCMGHNFPSFSWLNNIRTMIKW